VSESARTGQDEGTECCRGTPTDEGGEGAMISQDDRSHTRGVAASVESFDGSGSPALVEAQLRATNAFHAKTSKSRCASGRFASLRLPR
jgi:hypothetical protein